MQNKQKSSVDSVDSAIKFLIDSTALVIYIVVFAIKVCR